MIIFAILFLFMIYGTLLGFITFMGYKTNIKYQLYDDILNNLYVISSFNRAVVTFKNNNIIGQGMDGLNIVFIGDIGAHSFTRYYDPSDPLQYEMLLKLKILHNGYLIISARGDPFRDLAGDISLFMKRLGSDIDYFPPHNNYILISQYTDNVLVTHYESISEDLIIYPLIYTNKIGCLYNPTSLKPFKNDIYYMNSSGNRILSCALEAKSRGMNKFGLIDGECVPILKFNSNILKGSECVNGEGDRHYMSVYDINRYDINQDLEGVLLFETANFSGRKLLLTEGEHTNPLGGVNNSLTVARSIIMNNKYIFCGITDKNRIISFRGPIKKNINNFFKIINIMRIRDSSVIFYGNNVIYAYDIGRTEIPPYLYTKVNKVILGKDIKRLILYAGFNFSRVIENRTFSGSIEYPKIVRSIEIR